MKDKLIKETADKFRAENGNSNIDNNDLLIYIMTKIDALPCSEHLSDILSSKTWITVLKWYIPISTAIMLSLFGYITWS